MLAESGLRSVPTSPFKRFGRSQGQDFTLKIRHRVGMEVRLRPVRKPKNCSRKLGSGPRLSEPRKQGLRQRQNANGSNKRQRPWLNGRVLRRRPLGCNESVRQRQNGNDGNANARRQRRASGKGWRMSEPSDWRPSDFNAYEKSVRDGQGWLWSSLG
jgi:hypothetical protein